MNPIYTPNWITTPGVLRLIAEVPWLRVAETRSECMMAHGPVEYTYGKGRGVRTYSSTPFAAGVRECMADLNEVFAKTGWGPVNVCFLNRYDHEREHLGWHADDHRGTDHSRPIAVVSFGQVREIWYRWSCPHCLGAGRLASMHGDGESVACPTCGGVKPEVRRQALGDGSLFVMPPGFQATHQHRIPKGDRKMTTRVSLTFRAFLDQAAD